MKKLTISFLFISFVFIISCKKDKIENECLTVPQEEECQDIPPIGWTQTGYQWTKVLPYYETPHFNPNNSNELVFRLYENSGDQFFQLVKYNFTTQEIATIYQGDFAFPKWSKKDWILFSQSDFNIYKIKSNGDSLTQLTFSGNGASADWNLKGDQFIYANISNNSSIILSEDGIPLDTIEGGSLPMSWQHDSLLASISPAWLYVQNSNSQELDFRIIHEINSGGTTRAEWLDSDNIIWAYNDGIFKSNIISNETVLLQESCDAKVYQYPTVSIISNKVIFQRTDKELIETEVNKGTATSRMFIMNFDGSEREEIILPQ
jgi:hypothetical protein